MLQNLQNWSRNSVSFRVCLLITDHCNHRAFNHASDQRCTHCVLSHRVLTHDLIRHDNHLYANVCIPVGISKVILYHLQDQKLHSIPSLFVGRQLGCCDRILHRLSQERLCAVFADKVYTAVRKMLSLWLKAIWASTKECHWHDCYRTLFDPQSSKVPADTWLKLQR